MLLLLATTLKLIDTDNGNTLATAAAVPAMIWQGSYCNKSWTPESTAVNSVTGVVEFADDSNEADNKTDALQLTFNLKVLAL